jgi:hypothetical protein
MSLIISWLVRLVQNIDLQVLSWGWTPCNGIRWTYLRGSQPVLRHLQHHDNSTSSSIFMSHPRRNHVIRPLYYLILLGDLSSHIGTHICPGRSYKTYILYLWGCVDFERSTTGQHVVRVRNDSGCSIYPDFNVLSHRRASQRYRTRDRDNRAWRSLTQCFFFTPVT